MKKIITKDMLPLIVIPIAGFILLNITFILFFIFQSVCRIFLRIFVNFDPEMHFMWFPALMRILFVVVILIISFFILRIKKIKPILKAVFLTVPTATVLVVMGTFLYQSPLISYILGFILVSGVLYYFYKTKQPWFYYYSVILISLTLAIFTATGGEI